MSALMAMLITVGLSDILPADAPPVPDQLAPSARLAPEDARRMRDSETLRSTSTEVTIQRRVIIRIPIMPVPDTDAALPMAGALTIVRAPREPECLAMRDIRGATIRGRDDVVLISGLGMYYRARLERGCRAQAFQSGFYLQPSPDGAVCAGRDMLRARSGATCLIDGFNLIRGRRP